MSPPLPHSKSETVRFLILFLFLFLPFFMRIHPPSLARNTRRRGCSLSYEPLHQLNHETRKHTTFTCSPSLPPSPCQTCKTRPSGRVYMFVASLTLPIPSNTKNTPIWVYFSCSPPSLPNDTPRWACLRVVSISTR